MPFLGEMRTFTGTTPPPGWAWCDGALLQIAQNSALFTLLASRYGGNGSTNYRLPDLRGRVPLGRPLGSEPEIGDAGGAEEVTIDPSQVATHSHAFVASTAPGTTAAPAGSTLATSATMSLYNPNPPTTALGPDSTTDAGSAGPHPNVQPYQCVGFIIAVSSSFPYPSFG